ncbi:hypothetical protein K474DRAFT_1706453 [Panus rudis PR-1116 ss-1]|nr:hypothetical protein K474DRAFT_1706453 [Panus rudis PR-1116 ss-1]
MAEHRTTTTLSYGRSPHVATTDSVPLLPGQPQSVSVREPEPAHRASPEVLSVTETVESQRQDRQSFETTMSPPEYSPDALDPPAYSSRAPSIRGHDDVP